jgi:hypothetical protein
VKVSELEGEALDYWVARAEGHQVAKHTYSGGHHYTLYFASGDTGLPEYSTDWSQGGPIIEREKITIDTWQRSHDGSLDWAASFSHPVAHPTNPSKSPTHHRMRASTPLIAAMRAYVASKVGDEID